MVKSILWKEFPDINLNLLISDKVRSPVVSFVSWSHISSIVGLDSIVLVPVLGEPGAMRLSHAAHLATSLSVSTDSVTERAVLTTSGAATL